MTCSTGRTDSIDQHKFTLPAQNRTRSSTERSDDFCNCVERNLPPLATTPVDTNSYRHRQRLRQLRQPARLPQSLVRAVRLLQAAGLLLLLRWRASTYAGQTPPTSLTRIVGDYDQTDEGVSHCVTA